jgi:hypothetical protein
MKTHLTLILTTVLFLAGCTPPSMTMQVSGIRGAGDLAVTSILDNQSDARVDEVRTELVDIVNRLGELVSGDAAGVLTAPQLQEKVASIVPKRYKSLVETAMDQLEDREVKVKTDFIGKDNVIRLKALFVGAMRGLKLYDVTQREKPTPEPASVPAAEPPTDTGG